MKKILLIIERERSSGDYWGRLKYKEDLFIESALSVEELEIKLKSTINKISGINPETIDFDIVYDVTAVFQEKNFLNVSSVAERLGMNPSLLRQYAVGLKFPSLEKARQIEQVIHSFGNELLAVKVASGGVMVSQRDEEDINITTDISEGGFFVPPPPKTSKKSAPKSPIKN